MSEQGQYWRKRWRFGRVQFGWHLWKHEYPTLPPRWVLQPFFIYDAGV